MYKEINKTTKQKIKTAKGTMDNRATRKDRNIE